MFNVLAESKVKLEQFLEDCREEGFASLSVLNRPFNFSRSFCCCREGGGLKVKNAKILMVEADASGILLYENILKAADTELSGKQQCSPVAVGHSFPQQSILAAVRFLGANGCYSGATQLLRALHLTSPGEYFEGVF